MGAKKYICTSVEYIRADRVVSISDNTVVIKEGFSFEKLKTQSAVFSEKLVKGVNDYISQTINIKLINSDFNKNANPHKYIFRIKTSEGDAVIVGSLELPVRVNTIQTIVNENTFVFSCPSKRFLLG